jgi:hypothetical protein
VILAPPAVREVTKRFGGCLTAALTCPPPVSFGVGLLQGGKLSLCCLTFGNSLVDVIKVIVGRPALAPDEGAKFGHRLLIFGRFEAKSS